jgi:hypothetical protein
MKSHYSRVVTWVACAIGVASLSITSLADPLPGEVAKFQQLPMINTAIQGQIYFGHDELSTAYGVSATGAPVNYTGTFMADDFADKFTTPVVHLSWWGSYINEIPTAPQPRVQKFLIAFESDVFHPSACIGRCRTFRLWTYAPRV